MKLKKFLPLIGLALFVYIVYSIGLSKISEAFLQVKPSYLLLGAIAISLKPFLESLKWNMILKSQNIKVDFPYVFQVNFISQYYGAITPGKVGSLIKAFYLKKKTNLSLSTTSSSVIIDRLLDLIIVAGLSTVGVLILADAFLIEFNKTLIILVLIIIGSLILLNKNLTRLCLKLFYEFLTPKKYKAALRKSFYEFYDSFPKLKKMILPFILTAGIWVYMYSIAYIFALAFALTEVPIIPFIAINAIGTIIALIPITVSGLGTREAFLIGTLGVYGAAPEKIVLMSVTGTIVLTTIYVIGGLICIYKGKARL